MSYFDTQEEVFFEETLKLDGSSCTMYTHIEEYTIWQRIKNSFKGDFEASYSKFGVASRNLELPRGMDKTTAFINGDKTSEFSTSSFWKVAGKYGIEEKLPEGYAVQGELVGPKIQSNHEKVEGLEYYIFDVFDIEEQKYLTPQERVDFLEAHALMHLHIPIINPKVQIFKECVELETLLARVSGESMNKGVVSEGRVYKSLCGTRTFKAINNNFLLKFED